MHICLKKKTTEHKFPLKSLDNFPDSWYTVTVLFVPKPMALDGDREKSILVYVPGDVGGGNCLGTVLVYVVLVYLEWHSLSSTGHYRLNINYLEFYMQVFRVRRIT
jgi:hypothetical protein